MALSIDLDAQLLAGWSPRVKSWFTEQIVLMGLFEMRGPSSYRVTNTSSVLVVSSIGRRRWIIKQLRRGILPVLLGI